MHGKKPFFFLLALSAVCALFTVGLHAQLIEPTRSLQDASEGAGILNVLSEPPGIEVQVDGRLIGKTAVFSARFPAGVHVVSIRESEPKSTLRPAKPSPSAGSRGLSSKPPKRPSLPPKL